MTVAVDQRRPDPRPHVLFLNTRDGLGADVAVHLLLAHHLPSCDVAVTFTVNERAAAAPAMLAHLADAQGVSVLRCGLGAPVSGRGLRARLAAVAANAAVVVTLVRLAALIFRRHVDLLHTTDRPRDALLCMLLGFVTRRPSVIHLHNNFGSWMSRSTRWALRHCTCVVAISEHTARSLRDAGVPPERVVTVLNAIDSGFFDRTHVSPGGLRGRWSIPDDAPVVGLVGRLVPYKGHEDLLRAVAGEPGLATVHVLIVGDDLGDAGEFAESLRSLAASLGLSGRVHLTGLQDARAVYPELDVLAVPSWGEPFGLVVVEAMAMQVPVVAYRAGGIPEIIRSGLDGLLVSPGNTQELAQAIRGVVEDPELGRRLGQAGRRRVRERFSPQRQAAEAAALYRRLVSERRGLVSHVTSAAR